MNASKDKWLDFELDAMSIYRHGLENQHAIPEPVDEDADTIPIKTKAGIPKYIDATSNVFKIVVTM